MQNSKNKNWFIRTRSSYLPHSWQGGLIYIVYLAYLVWVLVFVIINHYKIWPAMFIVFPNWLTACVAVSWLASINSNKQQP